MCSSRPLACFPSAPYWGSVNQKWIADSKGFGFKVNNKEK
jgi:hypothetical protein